MIAALLGSRYVVYLALALALAGGVKVWLMQRDAKVEARTEQKVADRSEEQGKSNNDAAQKEIAGARRPGALDRLRADPKTCPDCGK